MLANIALREGARADVGLVVMDEFHYYGEPDRGWAWQVPLLELPNAQFVLMSATLGDMSEIAADLSARTGRETAVVADAERPVPLSFSWSLDPLDETVEELVTTGQAPAYVVHFTQAAAVEHATRLLGGRVSTRSPGEQKDAIAEKIGAFRFGAGFGKILQRLVKAGIGVHHAGMLPKYRRLVETLAQAGLLTVICGTDTLGVGINVPIRTVLFTGLAKFDGNRSAGPEDAGVPADRRPRRPGGLRHVRVRRRAGARARDREREGEGEVRREERRTRAPRRGRRRSPSRSSRSRPRARSCGPSRPSTSWWPASPSG